MTENNNYILIHISGKVGQNPLSPKNYDIRELKELLEYVSDLFYISGKKDRDLVTYEMSDGSVTNKFFTNIQRVVEVGSIFALVAANSSLSGLSPKTANSFDGIQKIARKTGYIFDFSTSQYNGSNILTISPDTSFIQDDPIWAEGEFYFYGQIIDAGGKIDPNIHLDVERIGTLVISSKKDYLKEQEKNLLYHTVGVRVKGRQNIINGEIDNKNMELVELIDYSPKYDEGYLNGLIKKASHSWSGVDADTYMEEIRGGAYDYH